VAAFRDRDPLTARMMQQLVAGVSTRQYEASLEAPPRGRRSRGSSKSAVSRTVVRRTRQRVAVQLTRRLDGLEVVALFLDGVVVAQQTLIVALGITRDGHKEPLGLRLGSTENAVVCTELLQDLLARGLPLDGRVLCVIDGGKGLRKALGELGLAERLIGELSHDTFKPEQYEDAYRSRVLDLASSKVEGKEITAVEPEAQRAQVIDLMDALKQSLAKRAAAVPAPASDRPGVPSAKKPPAKAPRRAAAPDRKAQGGRK